MIPPAARDTKRRCELESRRMNSEVNVVGLRLETRMRSRRRRNVRTLMTPEVKRTDALRAARPSRIANEVLERVRVKLKRVTRRARCPGAICHPVVKVSAVGRRRRDTHLRRHRGERPKK